MKEFVLHPWEHPAAKFNPRAHAETRLELGGKKRNFLLKLREGVLFFKEPSRAQIFAVPQIFEESLSTDAIGLISAFQREVAAGNYGALFTKRDYFPRLPVRGNFILLVCANGSGWMREHFDDLWFALPEWEKPLAFDLWGADLETRIPAILPSVKDSLLQRIVEPQVRKADTARWEGGTAEEFSALLLAASRLFLALPDSRESGSQLVFKVKSDSAFAPGERGYFWRKFADGKHTDLSFKSAYASPEHEVVWELLEKQFRFVGVKWSEGGEENEAYGRSRVESFFQEGLAQWGEEWRGNWAPQRASFEVAIPDFRNRSAVEKGEAVLLLREWLEGRLPGAQIEAMFG